MRILVFILAILIVLPTPLFAMQINPRVHGDIIKILPFKDFYIIASSNGIFVFNKNGKLINFVDIKDVSDIGISDSMLIVTTHTQLVPNVLAYSLYDLNKLWEFEPKMEVFDEYLVWDEKETRSWCVKIFGKDIGICSGHTFYLMDKNGHVVRSFRAENDVWDAEKLGDEYYLATQDGDVYILDSNLKFKSKINVVKEFKLIDPVTNTTRARFKRSTWQTLSYNDGIAAACEDGRVVFLENSRVKWDSVVEEQSKSLLYMYYQEIDRETGFGDRNFRNVKIIKAEDGIVVYTKNKIALLRDGDIVWERDVNLELAKNLCIHNNLLYVPQKPKKSESIAIYWVQNGSKKGTIFIENPVQEIESYYLFCGKDGIILASDNEIKYLSYREDVKWYFPRAREYDEIIDGDMIFLVPKMRRSEEPLDPWIAYFIIAMDKDGNIVWEYTLPYEKRKKGGIADIEVSKNFIALAYIRSSEKGYDELIVLNRTNGRVIYEGNVTKRVYAGILDKYLLNKTLMRIVRSFDFSVLDNILSEIKEGRIEDAINMYGEEEVMRWMSMLEKLPLDIELLEKLRGIDFKRIHEYMLRKNIRDISVGDMNADGVADIIVSARDFMLVLDGRNLKEIMFKDPRRWRYNDIEINRPFARNFTANWYEEDDTIVVPINDFNNDSKPELFVYKHDRYGLVESFGRDYRKVWMEKGIENIISERTRVVEDMDGDGMQEFMISRWRKNQPDIIEIISIKSRRRLASIEGSKVHIKFNAGDVDGDGKNESLAFFDMEGGMVKIFSPTKVIWEYKYVDDFWDVWRSYGYLFPIEVVRDVNGDGVRDVAIGLVRRWDSGAKIIFFDAKQKNVIKEVEIEKSKRYDDGDWTYVNEIVANGNLLAIALPAINGKSGKVIIYDMENDKIVGIVHESVRRILRLGSGFLFMRNDGGLVPFDVPEPIEVSIKTEGNKAHIEWDREGYAKVYVDGALAGRRRGRGMDIVLDNGEHEITVSVLSKGYENFATTKAKIFVPSSLSTLNIVLVLIIATLVVVKVWAMKR